VIPPEVGQIESLRKISLSRNPFIDELVPIAKEGTEKLLNFLRSEEYDGIYFKFLQSQK
jgi:ADP-heptose:LPS heptosyltransferase